MQFLKVVTLLAGRAANILEQSSLGSAAGVQTSTVADWIGALGIFGVGNPVHLITFGGELRPIKSGSYQVPIRLLRQFLLECLE